MGAAGQSRRRRARGAARQGGVGEGEPPGAVEGSRAGRSGPAGVKQRPGGGVAEMRGGQAEGGGRGGSSCALGSGQRAGAAAAGPPPPGGAGWGEAAGGRRGRKRAPSRQPGCLAMPPPPADRGLPAPAGSHWSSWGLHAPQRGRAAPPDDAEGAQLGALVGAAAVGMIKVVGSCCQDDTMMDLVAVGALDMEVSAAWTGTQFYLRLKPTLTRHLAPRRQCHPPQLFCSLRHLRRDTWHARPPNLGRRLPLEPLAADSPPPHFPSWRVLRVV